MWVGDAHESFRILRSITIRPEENPMIYHDLLYNLAILASYLDSPQEGEYSSRLEDLYRKMKPDYQETKKYLESKGRLEPEPRKKRIGFSPEKRLTYFISPEASRRVLRRDIAFVKGLARPEIRTVGRFRYNVEAGTLERYPPSLY